MSKVIEAVRKAAVEAVKASNPAAIVFGTVKSITPLKINIEQRLTLEEQHLVLTSLVSNFEVDMVLDHETEYTSGGSGEGSFENHNHAITGTKTVQINLGLNVGETVMMVQVQGGQKFIVLDRVR